jgi:DNA-binding NarL/FixJ family response regulator
MRGMTRVLIVDDHAEFRRATRERLEEDGFSVVGEAEDGDGALREAARLRPALVLLDVVLPGEDGFEVARRLADSGPDPPLVVLISTRAASAYRGLIEGSPARAFIPKDELSAERLREGRAVRGAPPGAALTVSAEPTRVA